MASDKMAPDDTALGFESGEEDDVLAAAEKEAKKDQEIRRIIGAFRLDAYAVLDLQPGVPEADIKATYRKKSLLIHPDKTKNEEAPDAFDRLKKAQLELLDEKKRTQLDEAIADARMLLLRENNWTADSEEIKTKDFLKMWRTKTMHVLVDNEQRRRRQLKGQMQEEGREQRRAEEELEDRKRKRKHDEDWEATRDQRIDNWRVFQKGKTSSNPEKKKKKKMKPIG